MTDLAQRIAELPPAKRDLLLRRLRERRGERGGAGSGLPRLEPDPAGLHEPFPLSPIQQAYWAGRSGLFDLGTVGANGYFELHFEEFPPPLLDRLAAAFRRLIARHPMLRMVVLPDGRQRILERVPPFEIPAEDLRGLDSERVEARLAASRAALRTVKAPVDRWPLYDLRAFFLDGDELRLQMRFELLVLDGVTRLYLFSELFDLFHDPERELPPLEASYRDVVLAWTSFRESPAFGRARDFWRRQLERMPPAPELPLACDVGPTTPSRFTNHEGPALGPEAWARLKGRAADLRLTPTSVALTAFAEVLAAFAREPRFALPVLGTFNPPIHPQVDRIVGNFNSLTLLPVEAAEGDFATRARRLQDFVAACLDHAWLSGFEVVRELDSRRGGTSKAPMPVLFDSLLELRHRRYDYLYAGDLGPGVRVRYVDHAGMYVSQFLLIAIVAEMGGALHQRWQHVEGVFPPGLVERMAEAQRRRLEELAVDEAAWHAPWPAVLRTLAGDGAGAAFPGAAADGEGTAVVLGYRVRLRRIEESLERHPAVRGARVRAWRGAAGRTRLWAWIVPAPGARPAPEELLESLRRSLPYYMLPAGFTFLDDWPLTLPPPPAERRATGGDPAQDPLARELARLWGEVLGREAGIQDDFFALGGDSLSLTRVAAWVRERFGEGLPLWELFDEPTPARLARLVRTHSPQQGGGQT